MSRCKLTSLLVQGEKIAHDLKQNLFRVFAYFRDGKIFITLSPYDFFFSEEKIYSLLLQNVS